MTGNCFRIFCKIVGLSGKSTTSRQHGNKTHLILMLLLMPEAERDREEVPRARLYPRLVDKI